MAEDEKSKSSGAVWDRLDQHGSFIAELGRAQAATDASVSALAESVKSGFEGINENFARHERNLQRYDDQQNRPTNWIGLGSLLIIVIGALLTFVTLQTDPVRITAMQNATELNAALERELAYARERGAIDARLTALEDEVRLIDQWGSRRWIESTE